MTTVTIHCGTCNGAIDIPAASNSGDIHCPWCLKDGPSREDLERAKGMQHDPRPPQGLDNAEKPKT